MVLTDIVNTDFLRRYEGNVPSMKALSYRRVLAMEAIVYGQFGSLVPLYETKGDM